MTLGLGDPDPSELPPDDGTPGPISAPVVHTRPRPGGIAVSSILHALIIALVLEAAIAKAPSAPPRRVTSGPRADAVFLPRPAQLRRLLGLPPPPAARPKPQVEKDRISIGPPAPMRTHEPLLLNRDDDLTKVAKGLPTASQAPRPVESTPPPMPARAAGATTGEGGRLTAPSVVGAGRPGPIMAALHRLETGAGDPGPLGVPSGTGGQMGPLFFDPEGADFTAWIQRFKNEVYRNWIVPPSASLGWAGQVDYEFVVDRSGTMTDVRLLESSGTGAYDRAARNALVASRLLPLPADFAPKTVTMKVGFVYNAPRSAEGGRSGR